MPSAFKLNSIIFFFAFCLISHASSQPIQELSKVFVIDSIHITGNKVTKEKIILRELEFTIGDSIQATSWAAIKKRSEENLLNTSLFNFAELQLIFLEENRYALDIQLVERWYTWPIPLFELAETNFNTWWLTKDLHKIDYGFYVIRENFRGRKESLKFRFRFGYDEQIAMQYSIPYLNREQTTGLEFTLGYSRNHEVNYGTLDNKRLFFKSQNGYARTSIFGRASLIYRKALYNKQVATLQYENIHIIDSLLLLNNDFLNAGQNQNMYLALSWLFANDKRDYIYYPLKGHYFMLDIKKTGLGILEDSGLNLLTVYSEYNTHFHIENRLYYACGLRTKINVLDNPPYYFQRGLGYSNFVRGYEYYVFDGQSYALFKSNFKLGLIEHRKGTFRFIKTEKFSKYHYSIYFNLFTDAGYVVDRLYAEENPQSNALIIGGGIGLDFLTYYDMVLRMEYSVNKFGEDGFYLHFVKPI